MAKKWQVDVFPSKFSVSQFQNTSGRTVHCFGKDRVSDTFMHKKETSLFSDETSLPHSAEIKRRVPFCFSENSGIEDIHA